MIATKFQAAAYLRQEADVGRHIAADERMNEEQGVEQRPPLGGRLVRQRINVVAEDSHPVQHAPAERRRGLHRHDRPLFRRRKKKKKATVRASV